MKVGFTIFSLLWYSYMSINVIAQDAFPGYDVIGKGYDIFGEYANNKSVFDYPIFDYSKMASSPNKATPRFIHLKNISNHVIKTIEGFSKREYVTNLSSQAGLSIDAYCFKGSVDNQFSSNTSASSNYLYYTYMDINTKWKVSLDTRNIDTLIKYLDSQFAYDLENSSPKEIFEHYGTHFIASAYLGGRIDYSTTAEMNNLVNTTEVKTAIDASYNMIEASTEIDTKSESVLKQTKASSKLNIVGGNSEFANSINNHAQYLKWAEGIKGAPVLSGFDDKSLKPIWILIKDQKRKEELIEYFNSVIVPSHPLPNYFKHDPILDNEDLSRQFSVNVIGFLINKDCDAGTVLGGDEDGEFKYRIKIYSNGELVKTFETEEGYVRKVWSGQYLTIDKIAKVTVPIVEDANIKVEWKLTEIDTYTDNERVGEGAQKHNSPFSIQDLYNVQDENENLFWETLLWHSEGCNATLQYQIISEQNTIAYDLGNKGWTEFEKGNYDKSLFYSKEALKLDNSLWFVHYNVGLVYLIQNNPRAYEKYKYITDLCDDEKLINEALKDILEYEKKHGELANSEPIKLWLKTKTK